MLGLKLSIFYLDSLTIQLQDIYYNIYNILLLNNQEILGLDIIFVGVIILFIIYVIDIRSLYIYSVNAGKQALKKLGIGLTAVGTAASIYSGGKELYKDIKNFKGESDSSNSNNTTNSSNNSGSSNTNNSSKKT